jgi:hypothetical protein
MGKMLERCDAGEQQVSVLAISDGSCDTSRIAIGRCDAKHGKKTTGPHRHAPGSQRGPTLADFSTPKVWFLLSGDFAYRIRPERLNREGLETEGPCSNRKDINSHFEMDRIFRQRLSVKRKYADGRVTPIPPGLMRSGHINASTRT